MSTPQASDPAVYYDSAHLRCNRVALGVRDDELAVIAGVEQRAISLWETRKAVPPFVIEALAIMAADAADETSRLAQTALRTAHIVTFDDDAATVIGTTGTIALASVHRTCAGRAAIMVPGADVVRRTADGDRPARLMCHAAAYGLGLKQLPRFLNVGQRTVQRWLLGDPPPDDVVAALDDLTAKARTHTSALAATADDNDRVPIIEVCSTPGELRTHWPDADIPLVTHHACAAHAAEHSAALLRYHRPAQR